MSGYGRGGSGRGGHSSELSYRGGRPGGSGGPRGGHQGSGGGGGQADPSVMFEEKAEPKQHVSQFENQSVEILKKSKPQTGELAYRPAYGTKGRDIVLRANYFEMDFKPDVKFHTYVVKIEPEPKPKRFLLEVWKQILAMPAICQVGVATDNATELVTLGDILPLSPLRIRVKDGANDHKDYTVDLSNSKVIDHKAIIAQLRDKTMRTIIANEAVFVRALNILMAAYPGTDRGVVTLGKGNNNKFYWVDHRQQSQDLGGGLECIRGYYASVRLAAGRVLLNLSVNHSAFYLAGPMWNLTNAFVQVNGQDRQLFHRYVKTLQVECTHLTDKTEDGQARRIKTIWGLADPTDGKDEKNPPIVARLGSCADNVKFYMEKRKDGTSGYVTIRKYFKDYYNMDLAHGNLPVMNVGNKKRPVYLPQDVLVIPRGRVFRGELHTVQRQNIIRFSCRRPPDNYASIMRSGLDITGARGGNTRPYGINISTQMLPVPARILNAPNLKYGNGKETPKFGSWNLRGKKFTNPLGVRSWAGVVITRDNNRPTDDAIMRALKAFGAKMAELGMRMDGLITTPLVVRLEGDQKTQLAQINDMLSKVKSRNVGLAVVLLSPNLDRIFEHLKWRADTIDGIVTHCCLTNKFVKPDNDQYFANNAMKVNLRLGGVNQTLDSSASPPLISGGKTMVVGLDVTHPSPTDPDTFPSIASIVASTGSSLGQWPGQVKIQESRNEKVLFLTEMLVTRFRRWKQDHSDKLPENILIYRDGVSEGQYNMVLTEELQSIKEACKTVYTKQKLPNISILVGGKRHNTRFFPTRQQDLDRTSNCPNGTVVDRGITRPIYWDFFLQAQSPLQGSARSAHYVVIHDEIFTNESLMGKGTNPSDAVQELTHNICYMMGRCTRSISYSTPAFLADRFADRARKYVRAYYYEHQVVRGNFRPPPPPSRVTELAGNLAESMVYI